MINVVAIMGRLVADPQLRQTSTGRTVSTIRIACDRGRKGPDGQSQADFLDVVAWERTAEFIGRYFRKGSLIGVDGRLQSRQYQDRSGTNRQAVEIVANSVHFCESRRTAAAPGGQDAPAATPAGTNAPGAGAAPQAAAQYAPDEDEDGFVLIDDGEDLPF